MAKNYSKKLIGHGLVSAVLAASSVSPALAQGERPDFSGVWTSYADPNAAPTSAAGFGGAGAPLPFTDEGRSRREEYQQIVVSTAGDDSGGTSRENPGAFCVTYGMPTMMLSVGAYPIEFIQRPDQFTIIYEVESETRRVYFEDRALPEERRFPNRQGYSVGRWEGNTLVVETTSLTDGQDQLNFPHSDQARITEQFSMHTDDNGTKVITYEMMMTDPVYYTEAVTTTRQWAPLPNGQIIAYNCPEEPWLKLLALRRAQLRAGEPITATMADVYATEMYE